MIDIESFVFSNVAEELRAKYPSIFVSGEAVDAPASFPTVTIVEDSNTVLEKARFGNQIENAATVMYEVNIYTNTVGYKKSEAKDILEVIDSVFANLGFTRIMANPMQNLMDIKIYRFVARYRGVVVPEYNGDDVNYRVYSR